MPDPGGSPCIRERTPLGTRGLSQFPARTAARRFGSTFRRFSRRSTVQRAHERRGVGRSTPATYDVPPRRGSRATARCLSAPSFDSEVEESTATRTNPVSRMYRAARRDFGSAGRSHPLALQLQVQASLPLPKRRTKNVVCPMCSRTCSGTSPRESFIRRLRCGLSSAGCWWVGDDADHLPWRGGSTRIGVGRARRGSVARRTLTCATNCASLTPTTWTSCTPAGPFWIATTPI